MKDNVLRPGYHVIVLVLVVVGQRGDEGPGRRELLADANFYIPGN